MWLVVIYRGKKKPRHKLFVDRGDAEEYVTEQFQALKKGANSYKGTELEHGFKFDVELEFEFLVPNKGGKP